MLLFMPNCNCIFSCWHQDPLGGPQKSLRLGGREWQNSKTGREDKGKFRFHMLCSFPVYILERLGLCFSDVYKHGFFLGIQRWHHKQTAGKTPSFSKLKKRFLLFHTSFSSAYRRSLLLSVFSLIFHGAWELKIFRKSPTPRESTQKHHFIFRILPNSVLPCSTSDTHLV